MNWSIEKRNAQFCFEESGNLSTSLHVRYFEDAYYIPSLGKENVLSYLTCCCLGFSFFKGFNFSFELYLNQKHFLDDLLKIAGSHTCQLCVASDNNNS